MTWSTFGARVCDLRAILAAVALGFALLPQQGLAADAGDAGHVHGKPGTGTPAVGKPAAARLNAGGSGAAYAAMAPFACAGEALSCATAATPAWAEDGSLWLAWVAGGAISIARSTDDGRTLGPPTVIARHGSHVDIGPDARPQIVIDREARILVFYSVFRDEQWNGQVLVARSTDGGRSFSTPAPVTPDAASQRFPAALLAADGSVFVAWIDKRLVAAAARQGHKVQGASVAYARSRDGGASFPEAGIAHAESCECCRIGVALQASGQPAIAFRDVFEQKTRDHALVLFDDSTAPGPPRRIAMDEWVTDACPHHGPALAIQRDGIVHATWYTQGRLRRGSFYARSTDAGKTFSSPMPVAGIPTRAVRPFVVASGTNGTNGADGTTGELLWMVWKTFNGQRTTAYARWSRDDGANWSEPKPIADATGYSDHPILVSHRGSTWLSWLAHDEGYRLIPLEATR